MLINTVSGQICDKSEQAASFESLSIFAKLVSSMTTHIDGISINQCVMQYYRYAMFSHMWEANEPLFDKVTRIVVYDLDDSPTHVKLKKFCKIVWAAGLHWAWSDTCCINKADDSALQEAMVARFKWYEGSAVTIVFLCDVLSPPRRGDLTKSIWNSLAWTWQEYRASKVIRFYTKDWKLYMNLDIPNHKDSPEVISEIEEAMGVSARAMMVLRPGLDDIREKLWLASTRQTTLVEDVAYFLFGIFSTSFPVVYGEGDQALGRLLAQLLTRSRDASILAWTGKSGSFNSCLPSNITVFNQLPPPHIPLAMPRTEIEPISDDEMERMVATSPSSFDLDMALSLYEHLNELSPPWFSGQQMKFPCIAFQLPPFSRHRTRSGCTVYRADTIAFGMMEIKTKNDISRIKTLYLVHPWLDTLLESKDRRSITAGEDTTPLPSPNADGKWISDEEFNAKYPWPPRPELPSSTPPMNREIRARRLVEHLRLPFGAILLALTLSGVRTDYKRVAADTLVRVQFEKNVSLTDILDNVRTLDVL